MLNFSPKEFLMVLENYNLAIWPTQIIAYVFIALLLFYLFIQTKYSTKIVLAVLSFFWLFNGIVFSLIFWSPSHFFGYTFGLLCIIQGLLFIYSIRSSDIIIGSPDKIDTSIGLLFVLYAVIGYQLFGYPLGHIYPKFFPAGLVPCPTAILTFGIFLMLKSRIPIKYYIIPLIISLGGFLAAHNGIYEDMGLILTGILGTILIARRNSRIANKEIQTT